MVIRFSSSFIEKTGEELLLLEDRHVKVMLGTSVRFFNELDYCIDTTSPNQDTTSPGAKQLAFWTQLAYNFSIDSDMILGTAGRSVYVLCR